MIITYNDAVALASVYLSKESNLRLFCHTHTLCYQNVVQIKNKKTQRDFPNLVVKILEIYGNNFTILQLFQKITILNKRKIVESLTYQQVNELACEFLNKQNNLREFCKTHKLGYQNVVWIKNKHKEREFPMLIVKILSIFGNNFTIIQSFKKIPDGFD